MSRDLAALVGFLLQGVDGGPDRRAGGGAVAPEREDVPRRLRVDRDDANRLWDGFTAEAWDHSVGSKVDERRHEATHRAVP